MKKISFLLISFLLILIPNVLADIVTFTSGGGNELVILPFSEGEIGFFSGIVEVVIPPVEEPRGGAGSGDIDIQLITETEEQKEICPENFRLWNDVCYPCEGQLAQVGNEIVCVYCKEGIYDINTDSCITDFELSPFFLIALLILVVVGYIVGRRDRKEQKKRKIEQEEIIKKRTKKMKENKRRML